MSQKVAVEGVVYWRSETGSEANLARLVPYGCNGRVVEHDLPTQNMANEHA